MRIGEHETHPAADVFPLMEGAEFKKLVDDVVEHGLREPVWRIWVDAGYGNGSRKPLILDGRNRLRACYEAGTKPEFRDYDGDDPVAFVVSLNLTRRHLDESQRSLVAARIATLQKGANQHASIEASSPQSDAAKLLNVGRSGVQRARRVIEKAAPEIVAAVERGEVAVSAAAVVADLPVEQQRKVIAEGPRAVREKAAEIRQARQSDKHADIDATREPDDVVEDDEWDETEAVTAVSRAIRAAIQKWPANVSIQPLELCLRMGIDAINARRKGAV